MSLVFIISAPSGSGKSTLVSEIRRIVPGLDFSVSYTTRPPRGSEQDGRDYFFVSREQFEEMVKQDAFIEHANVFGKYYGTARRFLNEAKEKKHDLLLDIDVQGAEQIKHKLPGAISIFILPPNREKLEWRLRNRGVNSDEEIQRRLDTAKREIENYSKYEYILVNDILEESTETLKAILLGERLMRSGIQQLSAEQKGTLARAATCRLEFDSVRDRIQPILASFKQAPVPSER
jgi:guanylate kinase